MSVSCFDIPICGHFFHSSLSSLTKENILYPESFYSLTPCTYWKQEIQQYFPRNHYFRNRHSVKLEESPYWTYQQLTDTYRETISTRSTSEHTWWACETGKIKHNTSRFHSLVITRLDWSSLYSILRKKCAILFFKMNKLNSLIHF